MQAIRRVTVPLTEDECNALRRLANAELRDPREQARYLLRAAMGLTGDGGDAMPQNAKNGAGVHQDIPSAVLP
jgi:hypothetical protein